MSNNQESPHVKLARYILEEYVKNGEIPELPVETAHELLNKKAGVFVSLKINGQLRGCIGTISPVMENIAYEIASNAISSGTRDYRFPPVTVQELPSIEYSVDVLSEAEPVDSISQLNPKEYGVIVTKGSRRGLLLPNLDGVDTVEQQLYIALSKAGISPDEGYEIERFKVVRYK